MLSSSELTEALGHSDSAARDQALFSLAAAGARSGVVADSALAVIDALGPDAFARPLQIRELPPSPETARRLFAAYKRSPHPQVAAWIADLPQSLIAPCEQEIHDLPTDDLKATLLARLELGRQSPEALWNQITASPSAPVMHALLSQEQFVAPRIAAVLSRPGDLLEATAVELAGRLHLGTALNQLLDRFTVADPVGSSAVTAVTRIGTAGAVTAIEQRCDRDPSAFRLRAASCLGGFRVPSAEAALHRLLLEEDETAIRCELAHSLAAICTTTSFDRICDLVRSGECPQASLKFQLAGLAVLIKKAIPELPQWRGRRELSDRSFAETLRQSPPRQSASIPSVHLDAPADESPEIRPEPPSPIRRADTKVGRNDPCPCGSGRKYKKCCGAG